MKIAYLGAGTWGIALATILAKNGHKVVVWTRKKEFADSLRTTRVHPKLRNVQIHEGLRFTSDLKEALDGAEIIVESVTSGAVRPVFSQIGPIRCPVVLTSKGIEQKSLLLLPEVLSELTKNKNLVGCLSGPSHAEEVIHDQPTSVVCSAYDPGLMKQIHELFKTPSFRIYPNSDIHGVCFGGAMKNVIAIACGITDGMQCGDNTKAALITRGLHEMRKLCLTKGCNPETLNGLSGIGDLIVTCFSQHGRNARFGRLIAEGKTTEQALQAIGMAVEGIYTCVSAYELARQHKIPVPITDATYAILYGGMDPKSAVKALLTRDIKEEHL